MLQYMLVLRGLAFSQNEEYKWALYVTKISFSSVILDSSLTEYFLRGEPDLPEGACSRFGFDTKEAELLLRVNFVPILFT